jgi:hypothetical protein
MQRIKQIGLDDFVKISCKLSVPRELFVSDYSRLKPIPTLDDEEKNNIRSFVHSLYPDADKRDLVTYSKVAYSIISRL